MVLKTVSVTLELALVESISVMIAGWLCVVPVNCDVLRVTPPIVSLDAAPGMPRYSKVPPVRVIVAPSLTRSGRFVAVLSRSSVPPALIVNPEVLISSPPPLTISEPSLTVVPPLKVFAAVTTMNPVPDLAIASLVKLSPMAPLMIRYVGLVIVNVVPPTRLVVPFKVSGSASAKPPEPPVPSTKAVSTNGLLSVCGPP